MLLLRLIAPRGNWMKSFALKLAAGCLALSCCLVAQGGHFPSSNFEAFSGVTAVDATVLVSRFDHERPPNKEVIEQHFKMGIMREGVAVRKSAPNYLFCTVTLFASQFTEGWYFTVELEFYDHAPTGSVNTLLYEATSMAVRPESDPWRLIGNECGRMFSSAWLRANTGSDG